jgi:Zn finger protein HypA/HybF involved in hydrogenase expression
VLSLSEVLEMKALRVEKFDSAFVSDDGEMKIKLHDRDGILCVKYIKDIFADDEHYYIVPHERYTRDECFQAMYRDFLVELPSEVRKMKWIVVDYYNKALCRDCLTVFRPTKIETELHGTQYIFTQCPRCGSLDYDLVSESFLEVHEY